MDNRIMKALTNGFMRENRTVARGTIIWMEKNEQGHQTTQKNLVIKGTERAINTSYNQQNE